MENYQRQRLIIRICHNRDK